MGVTVTTIGQPNLPAFYSSDSGIKSPQMSPSPDHAAKLIDANHRLKLGSSILVCVPIPHESSIEASEMANVIDAAIVAADQSGILGKDTTPFLLAAVSKATQGRSLKANIALVLNNARIGAQVASSLTRIAQSRSGDHKILQQQSSTIANSLFDLEEGFSLNVQPSAAAKTAMQPLKITEQADVLVIGGVAVDLTCSIDSRGVSLDSLLKTSNPGKVARTIGGVAGNIARALSLTKTSTLLCSSIGGVKSGTNEAIEPDTEGSYVLAGLAQSSLAQAISPQTDLRTATYTCVQANGELLVAVADMEIFTESRIHLPKAIQSDYKAIVVDANIPSAIQTLADANMDADIVCFEPTSSAKAASLFRTILKAQEDTAEGASNLSLWSQVWPNNRINLTTPNVHELEAMFDAARTSGYFESAEWWEVINNFDITSTFRMKLEHFLRSQTELRVDLVESGRVQQAIHLLPYLENIYLTLGSSGVISFHLRKKADNSADGRRVLLQKGPRSVLQIIYHPSAARLKRIVSDTGCGDTFTAVLISSLIRNRNISQSVSIAQQAAVMTLESSESVATGITQLISTQWN